MQYQAVFEHWSVLLRLCRFPIQPHKTNCLSRKKLAQAYDVAIVLVAHPKKTQGEFDNDAVSGSSDITNAVSYVWNYERGEQIGTGVARDIICDAEYAECSEALGVHAALRDDLAVQVAELFEKPGILHEHGTTRACGERAVVIGHRCPGSRGELVVHSPLL